MKRTLLVALVLMLFGGLAFALGPTLVISSDQQGWTYCELPGNPGTVTYYMLYLEEMYCVGVTNLNFTAPQPACMTNAVYLGDENFFPNVVGNTQTGYSVELGGCRCDAFCVCGIQYLISCHVTPCCQYQVFPQASWSCYAGGQWVVPTPGDAYINANENCRCVIPVRETTWGKVKSLYGE